MTSSKVDSVKKAFGAREMLQLLRALATLLEDLGLLGLPVPQCSSQPSTAPVPEILILSSGLFRYCMHVMHRHTFRQIAIHG